LTFKNLDIFIIDRYAIIMALVLLLVGLLIVVYSFGYMAHYEEQKKYYFFVTLFICSMLGLIFSGNLILMYIFWEITSICSWQLIGFYKKNVHLTAANKAFLVTFLGSSLMLFGISIIFYENQTFNLSFLKGKTISDLVSLFLLFGMLAKSAQLPFHIWLPEAGVAPTPVTALLHAAVLVKIGVYTFGRIFGFTFSISPEFQIIEIIIAISTILVAGLLAFIEQDIKKILAYSTISQLGYIFLGFATNVSTSITGAIFYIVSHSVAKAGLFLSVGIIEQNTHERNIINLGGLAKTMPINSISFLICGFSIIGFPLFSGFWAKFFVIKGIAEKGYITIGFLSILGAVLTLMYIMRIYNSVFLGEKKFEVKENTKGMVLVVLILAGISVILGILPHIVLNFIKKI
jgi:NADH:ubiquinone oxidoreductase subunit 5 (subunit L)/multisubunit Na+/H+ antiporter MnhA subunit